MRRCGRLDLAAPDHRPPRTLGIRIRKARPADSDELTRIAHAAKRFWKYPERMIRLWKSELTITPRFVADHPVYCAIQRARVVGFYALSGMRATRDLEHMWVDPKHIGSGVGRLLFSHLLGHLRRERVSRLVIASDPNAESFYRRLGARRVGTVPSRPAGRYLPLLVVRLRPSERSRRRLKRTRRGAVGRVQAGGAAGARKGPT
jgi:GNAT superfamily N-acetyltransferase